MTVEAMSSLPLQAGGAVAAAAGRTALWVISVYMRQPLRNTALAALIGLSAMAGANALYKQTHHHPAPMFGSFESAPAVVKKSAPVMPAAKPRKLAEAVSDETTGSVDEPVRTPAAVATLGNDDVMAVQQKLASMGMFTGTVDGLFGPRTSKAIKAFEASVGRAPRGQLTPDMLALVRNAQAPAVPAPVVASAAPVVSATISTPVVTAKVAIAAPAPAVEKTPLPAPTPLLAKSAAPVADVEDDPQVASLGNDAEDASPGVQTMQMTKPNTVTNAVAKRQVQTIAVRALPAAPDVTDPQAMPDRLAPVTEGTDASSDTSVVAAVQRGLNSLGFLHQKVDGIASETTAKAIRNFEVYFNYDVTGRVTKQLVNLLEQNGAEI